MLTKKKKFIHRIKLPSERILREYYECVFSSEVDTG